MPSATMSFMAGLRRRLARGALQHMAVKVEDYSEFLICQEATSCGMGSVCM